MTHKAWVGILLVLPIAGAAIGSAVTFLFMKAQGPTDEERIREYYLTQNAVYVSPHTLRKRMDRGETGYTLVDLRSSQEYEKEHIVGAINIPAYLNPDTSISLETEKEERERIVHAFRSLGKEKEIIVYCYSMPCMTGRKVGKLLSENGIYVKHLGIGWNEWRYFWNLWNHDGEKPVDGTAYVASGKEPGKPKRTDVFSPCQVGDLGC